jgi:hypothetical protein
MGFSPLKNELQNNYAVGARPQPLLARMRRYFGDCGGNATDGRHKTEAARKPGRAGRVLFVSKRQQAAQYFATTGTGAKLSNL